MFGDRCGYQVRLVKESVTSRGREAFRGDKHPTSLRNEAAKYLADGARLVWDRGEGFQEGIMSKAAAAWKNAVIATMISVVLSPIGVALGWLLSHYLQAPRMKIEYVNTTAFTEHHVWTPGVLKRLRNNRGLVASLRDQIREIHPSGEGVAECTRWIDDEGLWSDDCIPFVLDALNKMEGISGDIVVKLEANIRILEKYKKEVGIANASSRDVSQMDAPDLEPIPLQALTIAYAVASRDPASAAGQFRSQLQGFKADRRDIQPVKEDILRMKSHPETPRTGAVVFWVAVLNEGESDGVIPRRAKLYVDGAEIDLYTDQYTVVKSHSLAEIEFSIAETEGSKEIRQSLERRIKQQAEIKFDITIQTKGIRLRGSGTI